MDALEAYLLGGLSSAAATSPTLCRVSGYELDGAGQPVEGRTVAAALVRPPQATASALLEMGRLTATTNGSGYWFLDLIRERRYRIRIVEAGVDQVVTTPDASSAALLELLG